jgi:PAS domain S-box-containing protein
VIGWNHAAQELLGFSPEEVIGKPVRMFFAPLDGGPLVDPGQELECWGRTRVLRHRAGTPFGGCSTFPGWDRAGHHRPG